MELNEFRFISGRTFSQIALGMSLKTSQVERKDVEEKMERCAQVESAVRKSSLTW